jgi:hypothetical protein
MTAPVTEETKRVWQLKLEGLKNYEIAEIMGFTPDRVGRAILRGRAKGELPIPERVQPVCDRRQTYIRRGTISTVIEGLSERQNFWLVDEARKYECDSLAEYILELVRDAYEVENLE